MNLPPIKQGTRAHVELVPQVGLDGAMLLLVLIKERFYVEPDGRLARIGGALPVLSDQPWDEDDAETSSTKVPSDVCLRKPSTDVLVVGSAVAPDRRRVRELDVMVRVGPIERVLRVTGTRVWYRGAGGLALSPPEPFDEVPLRWELGWGGSDSSDPARPLEEPRNPVGRGVARGAATLLHQPGPQIEDPREPITGAGGHPAPVGVGAVGRSWMPRRQYAGTMDETWKKDRMPLLPADFDERFNQVAPPEQITREPLRGGERVQLHNLCADGGMQFELPRLHFFVGARLLAAGLTEHRSMLDTVLLQPNDRLLDLTWRAVVPVPRPAARLDYVQVHEKELR
jgi:hypothetical protein